MQKTIFVLGATGNLGGKITKALLKNGAEVKAIVRLETQTEKINELKKLGVKVFQVDTKNKSEISKHFKGADGVVSALAGLRETVIDSQKIFLDAAIEAGVKRFIPSDYSIDFTNLKEGQNRNLDLRRAFHKHMEKKFALSQVSNPGPFDHISCPNLTRLTLDRLQRLTVGRKT